MITLPPHVNHIMVAPLNWGLGHATRCIPLIKYLLKLNKKVTIGSDGEALALLKEEFPLLKHVELPSYKIQYRSESLLGLIKDNAINTIKAILSEKRVIKDFIDQEKPDLIISDNRYGIVSDKVPSFIITHQLQFVGTNFMLRKILSIGVCYYINRFDKCLIPDNNKSLLSGKISQNDCIKSKEYIGPLSRLYKEDRTKEFDLAIVLSGPEPARSNLEKILLKVLANIKLRIAFVRGTSEVFLNEEAYPNLKFYNRLNSTAINNLINASEVILSRAGYSSIMDYSVTKSKAILIPTPGQIEQAHLAKHLCGKPNFKIIDQKHLTSQKLYSEYRALRANI